MRNHCQFLFFLPKIMTKITPVCLPNAHAAMTKKKVIIIRPFRGDLQLCAIFVSCIKAMLFQRYKSKTIAKTFCILTLWRKILPWKSYLISKLMERGDHLSKNVILQGELGNIRQNAKKKGSLLLGSTSNSAAKCFYTNSHLSIQHFLISIELCK